MLESIINPKKVERHTWELFFIGLLYASVSVLLTSWVFAGDPVMAKYKGLLIVTFTVIFSLPYMYYAIKLEEKDSEEIKDSVKLLEEHGKALTAFMWLFLGFIVAFSFWYIFLGTADNYAVQIKTYCMINQPGNYDSCLNQYGIKGKVTGDLTTSGRFFAIFSNNMYVLIFTLIFSLLMGAGAIFILAWNASVISAAVVIFSKYELSKLPLGIARYMIHGFVEIGAYFVSALAGGIIGVAVIKHRFKGEKFWAVLQDSLILIVCAIILLVIGALIEVFITPTIFS